MPTKRTTKSAVKPNPATVLVEKPAAAEVRRTLEDLAAMGDGELAYMRKFKAADLRDLFPQTAELHPSVQLYALFAADGSPLILADSREAVVNGAWHNDLTMAVVH